MLVLRELRYCLQTLLRKYSIKSTNPEFISETFFDALVTVPNESIHIQLGEIIPALSREIGIEGEQMGNPVAVTL